MHEMQTNATDVPVCQSVSQSVCLSGGFTRLWCTKRLNRLREQTEIVFGVEDRRNIVLDGGPDPPLRGEEEAHLMQPLSTYFGLLLFSLVVLF